MKILITGATGLVGIHCVNALLNAEHEVHVLVRDPAKLSRVLEPLNIPAERCVIHQGDLNNEQTLRSALSACDGVVHAAGLFSNRKEDRALMEQTNVEGTRRVLTLAKNLKLDPIIHVSSILALFPPPGKRQRADDPVRSPKSVYAATKAAAETIAREFQQAGTPVTSVYPGAVQGPHDPTFSDGPKLIMRFLRSGSVLVTEGGLVYTDVRDLATLISRLIEPNQGPRRYMFGGNYLAHTELRSLLSNLTGRTLKAQKMPGWLMRGMGRVGDAISSLTGKSSPLTFEAASVLTGSVPCDDQPAIETFGLTPVTPEQSFRDLLIWMYRSGKLRAEQVGVLAEQ